MTFEYKPNPKRLGDQPVDQPGLFDEERMPLFSQLRKEQAHLNKCWPKGQEEPEYMRRVAEGNEAWIEAVHRIIRSFPADLSFTTDRVWFFLNERKVPEPRNRKAMGPAMKSAEKSGLVENTGEYRKSTRSECHGRPIPVYRRLGRGEGGP